MSLHRCLLNPQTSLALYQSILAAELLNYGGYLVEASDGLCLAAFVSPSKAL